MAGRRRHELTLHSFTPEERRAAADDRNARTGLTAWLQRLGREEEAEQVWREAVAAGGEPRPELAGSLQGLGRVQDAKRVRGCRLEPDFFDRR